MLSCSPYIFFLFQRESLALYALYSKNKPQSDFLLINHGQAFFKVRIVSRLPFLFFYICTLKTTQSWSVFEAVTLELWTLADALRDF